MSRISSIFLMCSLLTGCDKATESTNPELSCDISASYARNSVKPMISNGIHGTVSSMEGNCMPVILPATSTCTHCPVNRTLRIHTYTRSQDAVAAVAKPGFFQQVNTPMIREITTDAEGFYQAELPSGQYSVFIIENGLLHASGMDGNGGLNPVTIGTGKQKIDLVMRYKATF
jgi:hypothetical protein